MLVLNRAKAGTRLANEVAEAAGLLAADLAIQRLANRIVYAETLGQGRAVSEGPKHQAAQAEINALCAEILHHLQMADA